MAGSILIPHNQNAATSSTISKIKSQKINHFGSALAASPVAKTKRSARFRASKPRFGKVLPTKPLPQSTNELTGNPNSSEFYFSHMPILKNQRYDETDSLKTDPKTKHLEMFMLGLSHSRRWIFHLYDHFHVKANYNNLLQVKVSQHTPIVEWVYKILQAGQCAAIMLENNGICCTNLQTIKALCQSANVALVVIEGRSEKLN